MRRFTKVNESFICENCGKEIAPAKKTCRNHCPFCLCSKHVDELPGDRANPCQGLMDPIGYEPHPKKGLVLLFKCRRCQAIGRNKAILDDPIQADDYDRILRLSPLHNRPS